MNAFTPVPFPKSLHFISDYSWPFEATLYAEEEAFFPAARALCDAVQKTYGIYACMTDKRTLFSPNDVHGAHVLFCRAEMKEEAYRIEAVQGRATLYASTPAGAAHAASALFQMILAERDRVMLPEFTLSDMPDKEWRGVMLDLARNYIPLGAILRTVDLCWLVRCNRLHLHFADGDVYRLPSKVYPKLCHVDAYTKEEIAFLNQYAAARGVMVIPEIELPGHAAVFSRAYPDYFANSDVPGEAICPGKPGVFDRLESVLREVALLFPETPYLHIGGDEVSTESWKNCTDCLTYRKAHRLEDAHSLYAHCIARLAQIVVKLGRTPIVWEGFPAKGSESIPRETIVMEFESLYQDAPDLMQAGFRLINAAWKPLYLVPQSRVFPSSNPEAIYAWHPHRWDHWFQKSHAFLDGIEVEPTDDVLGAQVCMWEADDLHSAALVRQTLVTLSERGWNLERQMSFEAFWSRAAALLERAAPLIGR